MTKTIKATVTYRATITSEYTYEELGFEEGETPTEVELREAITVYTQQVGAGIDACIDCEKVDLV